MAQPGQPVAGGNKKKNGWVSAIISLVIIGGLFTLIWYFFVGFGPNIAYKTTSHFDERIAINAEANGQLPVLDEDGNPVLDDENNPVTEADGNYFEKLEFKEYAYEIYVVEVVDGKRQEYIVKTPHQLIENYLDDLYAHEHTSADTPIGLSLTNDEGEQSSYEAASLPSNNTFLSIVMSLLPVLLMVGFFVWMFKKQGSMGGVFEAGKNQAKRMTSDKRFGDIAGQEEVKEEVKEVVDFLKFPAKYKQAGARIPKGILLGGPPGTGKTLLAKATAGEAGVPFFFVSASNFIEMFAGMGAKRVREMFKDARRHSPSILFIDELDAIGKKRGSSLSGNDEREQTLNQILVEMDGMDENNGVLIIAATNRPDVLDPALLRPGRFDRTITVNNPDIKEREAILKLHAKGKRIENIVDFANIAKRTPGYSGAQLENIINEAALLSVRERTGVVTLDQLDEAIDRVAAGPAKKSRTITPEELKMVAYHEAGHAVIGLKVAAAEIVQKITIIPRGMAGGYTLMTPKKETFNYKKSELEAKIVSFMGGRAAEQIMYGEGEVSTGASNDIERATQIARAMVTQYGMSILGPVAYEKAQSAQFLGQGPMSKEYSDALAERIDEAIRELIIKSEKQAIAVIKKNKKLLALIADELLEKETIVFEEIEYIHKHLKRPPARKKVETKVEDKSLKDIIAEVEDDKKFLKTEIKPKAQVKKPATKNPAVKKAPTKKKTTTTKKD